MTTIYSIVYTKGIPRVDKLDMTRGVARAGGGGVTVCQSKGTHQVVTSFSPPVVGCLLKKNSQKGGSRAAQDPPPWPRPCMTADRKLKLKCNVSKTYKNWT